jgi:carbonic anhydrase/acetyltransferase-like protein (isoleucine patch superfamily)
MARASELLHRARFALWALALRARLRRHGARLELHAPHGARFGAAPRVRVHPLGRGGATFALTIGRGVDLGDGLALELWARGDNRLELGDGVYFLTAARVELRGGSIRLGPHASVRDGAVLKSDGELVVGEDVPISFGCVVACTESVRIDDHAGLAERVTVIDSDHSHDGSATPFLRQPVRSAAVHVGANVFVAANAMVLRGARIGPNAVIGAGSIVRAGEHAGGWLHAGIPAQPVKPLDRRG